MRTVAHGITRTDIYRQIHPPPLAIVVPATATQTIVAVGTAIAVAVVATAEVR